MLIFVFVTFKSLDIVSRDGSRELNFLHEEIRDVGTDSRWPLPLAKRVRQGKLP
jgi:hypothetical protein